MIKLVDKNGDSKINYSSVWWWAIGTPPSRHHTVLDTWWDEAERWLESLTSGQWQIINIIFLLQNLIKIKGKVGISMAHTVKIRLIRCSNTRFKCFFFKFFTLLYVQCISRHLIKNILCSGCCIDNSSMLDREGDQETSRWELEAQQNLLCFWAI